MILTVLQYCASALLVGLTIIILIAMANAAIAMMKGKNDGNRKN